MVVKKSEIYQSLYASSDKLRGCMGIRRDA